MKNDIAVPGLRLQAAHPPALGISDIELVV